MSWQTERDISAKRRSPMYRQLTEAERYTLSTLKRARWSLRRIAKFMGRSPSTFSREVRRNATVDDRKPRPLYIPSKAQEQANGRRRRSRRVKHHAPEVYAEVEARPLPTSINTSEANTSPNSRPRSGWRRCWGFLPRSSTPKTIYWPRCYYVGMSCPSARRRTFSNRSRVWNFPSRSGVVFPASNFIGPWVLNPSP